MSLFRYGPDSPYDHLKTEIDVEEARRKANTALDYRLKEIRYGKEAALMEPRVDYDYRGLCRRVGGKCNSTLTCDDFGTLEHDLRVLAAVCGDSVEGHNYTRPILVGLIRGLASKYGVWHAG